MAEVGPTQTGLFNYRTTPAGTTITITSAAGNRFVIRLEPGLYKGGPARNVVVLESPADFTGNAEHPTYMVAITPGSSRGDLMAYVLDAAKGTISVGDEVHLVDPWSGNESCRLLVTHMQITPTNEER